MDATLGPNAQRRSRSQALSWMASVGKVPLTCRSWRAIWGPTRGDALIRVNRQWRSVQDAALLSGLGQQARVEQSEALHHPDIIGLILGEIVRHDQQLGVVALELGNRLARELLRADGIDPLDDGRAGCRRDPREESQLLLVATIGGCAAGGACLCS